MCLYVVLRAKKQGYDYAGRFGRCLFGSALGGGRSRRDLSVRIEQADLQMMRFDKLGFNALIEVYENFLFFDCKGGMSFCFFCVAQKNEKKSRECLEVSKKAVSLQPRLRETGGEVR